ncbi:MAG: heavy metal translocating P-type ATPase [Clostridia bacterium]|nr:heavy metal translocating P-type ATPase [Clostridia bacterium]
MIIAIVSYIILGYDVFFAAIKNIFKKHSPDETFLMSLASIGALFLGEYIEAVMVMLFYQTGEYLSHKAQEKTKKSITSLLDERPDTARIKTEGGEKTIACSEIKVGDIVYVGAGEKIAVDGVVVSGTASLDTSSVTGESIPRSVKIGDTVLSGMMPINKPLAIKAEKEFSDSTLSKILKLVSEENDKKAKAERFITTFAKIYTPIVTVLAILIAFIVPLIINASFSEWIYKSLSFLVISCPCALVISVPLTYFASIGAAGKKGVLIKNALALDSLTKTHTAAFDKTGTITEGQIKILNIISDYPEKEVLRLASLLEIDSTHPIATAIKSAFSDELDRSEIIESEEIPARGIVATTKDGTLLLGSKKLLFENSVEFPETNNKNAIYLAKNGEFIAEIILGDNIKADSKNAISILKKSKIDIFMLTGDTEENARMTAEEVGIDNVKSQLLPEEKTEFVKKNQPILFVGDGINDSPSIAAATVGVAMGNIGSDAAIETADVVIMGDSLMKIPFILSHAKRTKRIAKENIAFAIGVKILVMILSILGIGGMWPAIFADVGVCLITIVNAIGIFFKKS